LVIGVAGRSQLELCALIAAAPPSRKTGRQSIITSTADGRGEEGNLMRVGSLGVAFVLAAGLVAPVIGAHAAGADSPTATISISCTAVTFSYTGFASTTNTIDIEQVTVEPFGPILANKSGATAFTFTGSSGTDTISIAGLVSDGETINGFASGTPIRHSSSWFTKSQRASSLDARSSAEFRHLNSRLQSLHDGLGQRTDRSPP
jgi:hypothetical protein